VRLVAAEKVHNVRWNISDIFGMEHRSHDSAVAAVAVVAAAAAAAAAAATDIA